MNSAAGGLPRAVSVECRYSYDDLFTAATGRKMSDAEARDFSSLSQADKNTVVRELVAMTDGEYTSTDRHGPDGVSYTAFWRVADTFDPTKEPLQA